MKYINKNVEVGSYYEAWDNIAVCFEIRRFPGHEGPVPEDDEYVQTIKRLLFGERPEDVNYLRGLTFRSDFDNEVKRMPEELVAL